MDNITLPSGKRVSDLKVPTLRKELTKRGLSKLGKKQELVDRLAEFLLNERLTENADSTDDDLAGASEEPSVINDEIMEEEKQGKASITPTIAGTPKVNFRKHSHRRSSRILNEESDISENSLLSEDGVNVSPKSIVPNKRKSLMKAAVRNDEMMEVDQDIAVENPPTAESNNAQQDAASENTTASTSTKSAIPVPAKTKTVSKGRVQNRFKNAHSKLVENADTLEQAQEKIRKRHQELTGNVPDVVKRLATPKSVTKRIPLSKRNLGTPGPSINFDPSVDLTQKDVFKFGNAPVSDFGKIVASNKDSLVETKKTIVRKDKAKEHQMGAKEMAKKRARTVPIPLTRPLENTFINFMSTPKGKKAEKEPKRKGYTPYKGAVKFVDTTKLTAMEYELALEEGLIPATSKKSTTTSKTSAEIAKLNRKQRMDQVLSIRRKLNVQ